MQAIISPGRPEGTVVVPSSKSMMQRACAAALLHHGTTIIRRPGSSEDDRAAIRIIQQLGARVIAASGSIEVISDGVVTGANEIDCGESGLSARMFTPVAALSKDAIRITGRGSLLNRPMTAFRSIFDQLGVSYTDTNGNLPLTVQGPLAAQSITLDGSISSQFLTGILFALAAVAAKPVTVNVTGLVSRPYIDLSLQVLQQFGKTIVNRDYKNFFIEPAGFNTVPLVDIEIEPDWSSAAFWVAAAVINGNIILPSLSVPSVQADRRILDITKAMGGKISFGSDYVDIRSAPLHAFRFDATDAPDLFPILSILAACADGESQLAGLSRLVHKESDRAQSIIKMLNLFGVTYRVDEDVLYVTGRRQLKSATIHSCNDHRIAMAAAVGALNADAPVIINGAEAVEKSYPDFFAHLSSLGIQCTINTKA